MLLGEYLFIYSGSTSSSTLGVVLELLGDRIKRDSSAFLQLFVGLSSVFCRFVFSFSFGSSSFVRPFLFSCVSVCRQLVCRSSLSVRSLSIHLLGGSSSFVRPFFFSFLSAFLQLFVGLSSFIRSVCLQLSVSLSSICRSVYRQLVVILSSVGRSVCRQLVCRGLSFFEIGGVLFGVFVACVLLVGMMAGLLIENEKNGYNSAYEASDSFCVCRGCCCSVCGRCEEE